VSDLGTLFETAEDRAVAHAERVLRGDTGCALKPTDRQMRLLRLVLARRGMAQAISISELAEKLRTSAREVKGDVRDLRLLFGCRIGSSRDQRAGGYYLITSTKELHATATPLLHQLRSEAAVIRKMCEPHELAELEGQLRLDVEVK
jgi:hypothetical protein